MSQGTGQPRPPPLRPPEVAAPAAPDGAASLSANASNALIHLYRGELGRLTAYRARLDTTTSWAISASALVATLTFGSAAAPHIAFLFLMALNCVFLIMESRRYRYYELSRHRVHIMERFFYPAVLGQKVNPQWTSMLVQSLQHPSLPLSRRAALGWRLRRTYLALFAMVLVGWLSKLDLTHGLATGPLDLIRLAEVGSIPGWLIWLVVLTLYAWLTYLALTAHRAYPMGDEDARELFGMVGD
jgi:uncharacterized membrane protein